MSFIGEGLRAGYGKSVVLRDVDLEVDEGEAVAVVGKNGAGKSTLLMSSSAAHRQRRLDRGRRRRTARLPAFGRPSRARRCRRRAE